MTFQLHPRHLSSYSHMMSKGCPITKTKRIVFKFLPFLEGEPGSLGSPFSCIKIHESDVSMAPNPTFPWPVGLPLSNKPSYSVKSAYLGSWKHHGKSGCFLFSSPLKIDGWKTTFLLGRPILRGYVSFRGSVSFLFSMSNEKGSL